MIKLEHIYKDFKSSNGTLSVLKDINLTINDEDFITVIGSNGSGKSTLLNVIAGSLLPTKGSIFLDDKNITKLKEHKRAKYISRVFQDVTLGTIGDISIEENLALAFKRDEKRTLKWALKKENLSFYEDKLKAVDLALETRLKAKINTLSGGQRQAVTLLMATLKKPEVLLLDEHTAALDPKTSKKIMKITEDIIKENKLSAVMITHNMKDALRFGNRLIMISGGRIILDASKEEKEKLTVEDLYNKFEEFEANIDN